MPRAIGPFQIIQKLRNNAYKVDLLEEYSGSNTFNIGDLKPYTKPTELRTILPQEGGVKLSMQGTHGSSMTLEEDKHEDEANQVLTQRLQDCTKGKQNKQNCQPPPADQQTLQPFHRANLSIPGDTKGRIRISMHGPYYHGPRFLLKIIEDAQGMMLKLGCSADSTAE